MIHFIKKILLKSFLVAFCVLLILSCKEDKEEPSKGTCKDGIKNQDEIAIDCGGVCDGCPTCADGIKNQNEEKVDCGGVCNPCPKVASCKDGVRNQDETGIDCGGKCPPCDINATCSDKKKNQSETGIDCGGPCPACPSCKDGKKNQGETDIDCGGPCAPCSKDANCSDGKKNQNETGIDCGGNCPACPSCKDGKKNQDEKKIDCGGSKCPPCASCKDKKRNQGEKGIDCGGPCPNKCASCTDGKKNQGETEIDCGGPCAPCGGDAARRAAVNDFFTNYVGSIVGDKNIGWTGDKAKCIAGTVSKTTKDKVLQRINYFRRLVGLNDNITWNESKFKMYQESALIQYANGKLTHTPDASWKCYSKLGYDGSRTANLSYQHASNAITDFIHDFGAHNGHVGHRRWIFNSRATKFSFGTCNRFMALGVIGIGGPRNTKIPKFIAYPSNGYFPQELVFPRWSFGVPGADFSRAKVKMTGPNGQNIPLKINPYMGRRGDNTMVWEPEKGKVDVNNTKDLKYTVTITDVFVRGAKKPPYVYSVVIIKP